MPEIVEEAFSARQRSKRPCKQADAAVWTKKAARLRRALRRAITPARRLGKSCDKCAESFATFGPDFANVWLDGKLLIRREELRRMYKDEFKLLTPAQRLESRASATLETRMRQLGEQHVQAV